jgi:hypothetical protein
MTLAADDPEAQARVATFTQELQELGWSVGRNLGIDYRCSAGDAELTASMLGNWSRLRRASLRPRSTHLSGRCNRRAAACRSYASTSWMIRHSEKRNFVIAITRNEPDCVNPLTFSGPEVN